MTATHAGALADAVAAAAAGGADHGRSAASWTFDGDTDRGTYRKCLDLDEEGDPAWDDLFGARPPLSGEWSGDPTPATVLAEYGGPGLDDEAIVTAYEDAYYEAYREAVLSTARYHTADDESIDPNVEVW